MKEVYCKKKRLQDTPKALFECQYVCHLISTRRIDDFVLSDEIVTV
jgi:hypothetical protein